MDVGVGSVAAASCEVWEGRLSEIGWKDVTIMWMGVAHTAHGTEGLKPTVSWRMFDVCVL